MTNSLLLNMAIEIVRFPMKNVIFHTYVTVPKGNNNNDKKLDKN